MNKEELRDSWKKSSKKYYHEKVKPFRAALGESKEPYAQFRCVLCGWFSSTIDNFSYHEPEVTLKYFSGYKNIRVEKGHISIEYIEQLKKAVDEIYESLHEGE